MKATLAISATALLAATACGFGSAASGGEDLSDDFDIRAKSLEDSWPDHRSMIEPLLLLDTAVHFAASPANEQVTTFYQVSGDLTGSHTSATVRTSDTEVELDPLTVEEALESFLYLAPPDLDCDVDELDSDSNDSTDDAGVKPDATSVGCVIVEVQSISEGVGQRWTTHGWAMVPVWEFEAPDGSSFDLSAVAFDEAPAHLIVEATPHQPGTFTSAEYLTEIGDQSITAAFLISACESDIVTFVHETDELVVIGGQSHMVEDFCIMVGVFEPVEIQLSGPLGDRMVVDAGTGRILPFQSSGH